MTLEQAIVTFIVALAAQLPVLAAGIAVYLKGRETSAKVDVNTELTRRGTAAAATNAAAARTAASEAKVATETMAQDVAKKLNGGLDGAVEAAIKPVRDALAEHSANDEKNMAEISAKFSGLTDYVHQRNHDVLSALQVQSTKLSLLLEKANRS